MKYCTKCGAQCSDTEKFCKHCGNPLGAPASQGGTQNTQGSSANTNYDYNTSTNMNYNNSAPRGNYPGIAPRNIVVAILLSIVTCGIYGIYWMIKLNDEINILAGEPEATSGGIVFLLGLVTCGIYTFYWLYKMGERCDRIKGVNGNSNILFLILGLFALSIVDYCLMQDTINKAL